MSKFNKTLKNSAWCAVCKSAGRPESEYTSHFVKDKPGPEGVVVCKYLLSMTCRYCKKTGHTPKHCDVLKHRNILNKNNNVDKSKKFESFVSKPLLVAPKTCDTQNAFDLLSQESGDDDDHDELYDSSDDTPVASVDTFVSEFHQKKKTWADIAGLPKENNTRVVPVELHEYPLLNLTHCDW